MVQTNVDNPGQNINLLSPQQYVATISGSDREVELEIYKATPGENICAYTQYKPPLLLNLAQTDFGVPSETGILFADFPVCRAIAVCCRPNYRSSDFPENPRYKNL